MRTILCILGLCFLSVSWAQTGGVGINRTGTTPDPSALVDMNDTLGGVLFPRMTTVQRNNIQTPAGGLMIFNTDNRCLEMYNPSSGRWQRMFCLCDYPVPPVTNAASNIGFSSFTANWQLVPGATSYYLDLATDSNFQFMLPGYSDLFVGNQNSVDLASLPCDTSLYYRIRAGVSCGSGDNSVKQRVQMGTCVFCTRVGTNGADYVRGIFPQANGDYIIAGMIGSSGAGDNDFYVARIDANQNFVWKKSIGGTSNDYMEFSGATQTTDGNIVLGGYSSSFTVGSPGYNRIYAVKIDVNGNVLWKTVAGSGTTNSQQALSISATPDGGVVLTGYSSASGWTAGSNDPFVVKLDVNGTFQWARRFGTSNDEYGYSIASGSDGSIYVSGAVYTGSNWDLLVGKFDASGNYVWGQRIGGTSDDWGFASSLDANGNLYVTGYTYSFSSAGADVYIVKIAPNGSLIWTKSIGGSSDDYGYGIKVINNELYVTGQTNSFGFGANDLILAKLDLNGNLIKAVAIGSTGGEDGYAIAGGTNSILVGGYSSFQTFGSTDMYIAKVDNQLNGCCSMNISPLQTSGGTINSFGSSGTISSVSVGTGGTENTPASIQVICN